MNYEDKGELEIAGADGANVPVNRSQPSNNTMKVFYPAEDRSKLSDPNYKFYADKNHVDLRGKVVATTGYIGNNIIYGVGDCKTAEDSPKAAPEVLPEAPTPEPAQPETGAVPAKTTKKSTKKKNTKKNKETSSNE